MLKLTRKHTLHFPHVDTLLPHPMQLSLVGADNDELSQAIVSDPVDHDNNWDLVDRPDTAELEAFWTRVTEDLRNDPEWVDFGRD